MPTKDPEKKRLNNRRSMLYRRWKLTLDEYDQILKLQNGVCAICHHPSTTHNNRALSVDHDHKTGKVRGLLCHGCNTGIGNLKDNPDFCRRAVHYLTKHGEPQ